MLYRIIHQVVAIPAQPYLIPRGVASTTRGHCQRYQLPYSRLQCHQQSFFPSTIRLWNELPAEAISASTLDNSRCLQDQPTNTVGRTNVVVDSVIIFCQSRKTRIFTFFISLEKHLKFIIS